MRLIANLRFSGRWLHRGRPAAGFLDRGRGNAIMGS